MYTVLPTIGHLVWRWMELQGLDAAALFAQQEIARQDIQPNRDRIGTDGLDLVLASALDKTGDTCCGLYAARCWHPSDLGALGYAWLASSSIRTAVQRMVRYSRVVGEKTTVTTSDTPRGLRVSLEQKPREARIRGVIADISMSVMVDMCRFNAGAALRPVDVTLRREPPPDCAERYSAFFGCNVRFASDEDSFMLANGDADQTLPTANRQLASLHDQLLTRQLAGLHRDDVLTRCEAIILDNLTSGDISLEQVAEALHMSPRTLTRRLNSHGTSLKVLVDDTRRRLASRYLADPQASITEVAFLLGFSHPSSLSRAAQRWFGLSPQEYRSTQITVTATH